MERLFLILGRINTVMLFFVLIGTGLAVALMAWGSSWRNPRAIEVATGDPAAKKSVQLTIERAENVTGGNTQMLKLYARQSSGGFSSDSYGGETRNVLFLSGNEKTARWLFPTQSNLILIATQLQERLNDGFDSRHPTTALYFEYVTEDSNRDGKLSGQDHITVALTKPDGSALAEILPKVGRVLSYTMLDEQTLSIVYEIGKVVRHTKVSTLSLTKESDQEIVKLPEML